MDAKIFLLALIIGLPAIAFVVVGVRMERKLRELENEVEKWQQRKDTDE